MNECPFCNSSGDDLTFHTEPSQADERILCHVLCLKCGALGPKMYNIDDAENAWDNRGECKHSGVLVAAHGYVCTLCGKYLQ